ncbi:MAG: protein translocase subunit SecD [Lachnospiraceae bacterium]|nr:protein translocase subunit SecD [Lachnospiraceae bacterium]
MKKGLSSVLFALSLIAIAVIAGITYFGVGENHTGSAKNVKLGLDLKGGVSITYQVKNDSFTEEEFNDTKNKLEKRVFTYSTESQVYAVGTDRITVDIPGEYDDAKVAEELGRPGSLQFVSDSGKKDDPSTEVNEAYTVWLNGTDIADAQPNTQSSSTGDGLSTDGLSYVVALKMTEEGTKKLAEATLQLMDQELAIMYDGEIISAPVVSAVITNGECVITGMDTYEVADELASMIRIGSLSLELEQISSSVVGAKLGNDALGSSVTAGLIGFLIVIIFMIIVYRVPGLVSSFALILYIALEMLIMQAFNLTLTLPGIAGIILSIGMAVDANVIIYARIKEEIAAGERVETAIKTGFKKATSAIVDGNITTFIAALILMWKGSGPVQGFAQTLAVGILTSMFTAMVISRFLMYLVFRMGVKDKKFYGAAKERKPINFLGKKNICLIISGLVIAAGLVFMGIKSASGEGFLNYSVEFRGGTSVTAEYKENYDIDYFNENIKPVIQEIIGDTDVQGQCYIDSSEIVIRMKELNNVNLATGTDATATDIDNTENQVLAEVKKVLVEQFGAIESSFQTDYISSSVSEEMKSDAIISVLLATLCMLLYIWMRFKDLKFATSAIIALLHDVLIVLVFYGVARISVDNTFIACMLTIVGYSINATIVIFDRIRENLEFMGPKETYADVVNKSITQTLTRSLYTTFTTFITIFMVFLLGVNSIRLFAMPLIVGIIVGAYSSVFITGALWYSMKMISEKRKAKRADKKE